MDEHGCAGCDTKAKVIRQLLAAVKEYCETVCVYGSHRVPKICAECPLSKPVKHSRVHINQVLAGELDDPAEQVKARICRGLGYVA